MRVDAGLPGPERDSEPTRQVRSPGELATLATVQPRCRDTSPPQIADVAARLPGHPATTVESLVRLRLI